MTRRFLTAACAIFLGFGALTTAPVTSSSEAGEITGSGGISTFRASRKDVRDYRKNKRATTSGIYFDGEGRHGLRDVRREAREERRDSRRERRHERREARRERRDERRASRGVGTLSVETTNRSDIR